MDDLAILKSVFHSLGFDADAVISFKREEESIVNEHVLSAIKIDLNFALAEDCGANHEDIFKLKQKIVSLQTGRTALLPRFN
jgi:hypothetical protein